MPSVLVGAVLVALLMPIAVIDVRRRIIPNRLTAAGSLAAIAFGVCSGDPALLAERLLAGVAAGGVLLVAALARPGAMGMGDVKLAAVLGLFLGRDVAVALLVALLGGVAAGLVLMGRLGPARARTATIPFGPFLAAGGVVALVAGSDVVAWYLGG